MSKRNLEWGDYKEKITKKRTGKKKDKAGPSGLCGSITVQKGVDKPTRLLHFAFVHLQFSFRSLDLFCSFTLVYEGHFVLCDKEKIELLDRVMANFERS